MILRRLSALFLFAFISSIALFSAPSSIPGLSRFVLNNGLELFILERHDVPIASIRIGFRCGGISQTAETAGLFHLHEHVLFKGNSLAPDEGDFAAALSEIGATQVNGGTGEESVNFRLSVPVQSLERAFTLWSAALVDPLFSPDSIEQEKTILDAEQRARFSDPDMIYKAALSRRVLRQYPWRADIFGNPDMVAKADQAALKALHQKWFIPNNAILFVGGDVDPEKIREMAEHEFAAWKAGPDPWKSALPRQLTPGVVRPTWVVFPDPSLSDAEGRVEMRYRGPDVQAEGASAVVAELLAELLSNPSSRFAKTLAENVPGLKGPEAISARYFARRDGATFSITATFSINSTNTVSEIAQRYFKEQARGVELFSASTDATYFPPEQMNLAKLRIADNRLISLETPGGFGDALVYWWAVSSSDFFLSLPYAVDRLRTAEIQAFIRRWFMQNLELTALRISPAVFERDKKALISSGFEIITPETAFWWKKK